MPLPEAEQLHSYDRYCFVHAPHIELIVIAVPLEDVNLVTASSLASLRAVPRPGDAQALRVVTNLADGRRIRSPVAQPAAVATEPYFPAFLFLYHRAQKRLLACIKYTLRHPIDRCDVELDVLAASARYKQMRLGSHLLHQFVVWWGNRSIELENLPLQDSHEFGVPHHGEAAATLYKNAGFYFYPEDRGLPQPSGMKRLPMWDPATLGPDVTPASHVGLYRLCRFMGRKYEDAQPLNEQRWHAYQNWVASLPPLPTEARLLGLEQEPWIPSFGPAGPLILDLRQ
jgi:hypothetical protein